MPLTHTVINKLQPSSTSIDTKRPDKHSDGNGLQLWVRYTGVKSWISAYRWQGKQQTLTIGTYPVMNRPEIVGDLTFWENTTMKTRNYTPEMKERAVRMLIEAKDDYPSTWSAIKAIAPKIGCTPETLRSWHKKHIDKTIPAKIQAQSQAERIKELERENRELKQANEIIKKAAAFFAQAELDRKPK